MAEYNGFILQSENIVDIRIVSGSTMLLMPSQPTYGFTEPMSTFIATEAIAPQPIYRGLVGGNYVFRLGSPPVGATDVVIVGYNDP